MEILIAIKALFLFQPYTIFGRWYEISLGILAWFNIFLILYIIFN